MKSVILVNGNNACVVSIKNVKVGITICEDIWFAEPIKKSRGAGAELVINLNASPYQLNKTQQRLEVLRQRIYRTKNTYCLCKPNWWTR